MVSLEMYSPTLSAQTQTRTDQANAFLVSPLRSRRTDYESNPYALHNMETVHCCRRSASAFHFLIAISLHSKGNLQRHNTQRMVTGK